MAYKYAVFATFADRAAAQAALDGLVDEPTLDLSTRLYDRPARDCAGQGGADDGRPGDRGDAEFVAGVLAGLMNNCTRAESDVRRGVRIGIGVGATLGTGFGYLLSRLLEFEPGFGLLLGVVMGTTVGALMSGIVGAGLVNPRLERAIRELQPGQALASVSTRRREDHERVGRALQPGCIAFATDGR
ncbi:MAG: hypothetical protein NXI31_17420 [bacterium]|nr:hypothetical protein [bacterium]